MSPTVVEALIGTTTDIGLEATTAAQLDTYRLTRDHIQAIEIPNPRGIRVDETFGLEFDFKFSRLSLRGSTSKSVREDQSLTNVSGYHNLRQRATISQTGLALFGRGVRIGSSNSSMAFVQND